MKKKYIVILTFFIFIFMQPMTVYADMGPKPCIYFAFENIGDRTIYASLYALEGGPSPVSSGNWRQVPEEIKQTFLNYSEKEKARFVEDIWIINEENPRMACGYMPPEKYKLVVCLPDEDKMLESDFYTRQKFEEVYIVDINKISEDGRLLLENDSYDWMGAALLVTVRAVLTIIIEIGVAFLFQIKGKKSICVLIVTNVVTQLFLNISLLWNISLYGMGLYTALLYLLTEIIISAAEAFVYSVALKKTNDPPIGTYEATVYSLAANLTSFLAGLFLGQFILRWI